MGSAHITTRFYLQNKFSAIRQFFASQGSSNYLLAQENEQLTRKLIFRLKKEL